MSVDDKTIFDKHRELVKEGKIEEMNKTCGKKLNTVPQVVIDGEHIGGFTETERYINQKK